MSPTNRLNRLAIILVVLGLGTLACVTVTVWNMTNSLVVVSVSMPDGSYYTKELSPGFQASFDSMESGTFTVTGKASEWYKQEILKTREEISQTVFADIATGSFSPEIMEELSQKLIKLQSALDAIPEHGTSCSGEIPEVDIEDENAEPAEITVTIDEALREGSWDCIIEE